MNDLLCFMGGLAGARVWHWHFEHCDFPGLSVEGADGEH